MDEYNEIHRPQLHFTAKKNWINDPNGLVYCDGTWHLFFQHNPKSNIWGNMTWGHAVSSDLIHWKQIEHALYPDEHGTMFSGSAVIDHENTAGFGKGAMLIFYTAAGEYVSPARPFTQCLAYSTDNGVTIHKYEGNPIIGSFEKGNRDPKVIWHKDSQQWIMALYLIGNKYCLLRSSDAKTWSRFQDLCLPGVTECPDFFPLKDDAGCTRWIFWGAEGIYLIGSFDGHKFLEETGALISEHGNNAYAAQTWSDSPDGRRIQISWMNRGLYPEMPFNHQMSIPLELSLSGSGEDVILRRWPVKEVEKLRNNSLKLESQKIEDWRAPFEIEAAGELLDVSFSAYSRSEGRLHVLIRGQSMVLDWGKRQLSFQNHSFSLDQSPWIEIRLLIDKTSVEIFINKGLISASCTFLPGAYIHPLTMYSDGIQKVDDIEIHELEPIW